MCWAKKLLMWHLIRSLSCLTRAGLSARRLPGLRLGLSSRVGLLLCKALFADGFSTVLSLSTSLIIVMIISMAWYILRARVISVNTVSTV